MSTRPPRTPRTERVYALHRCTDGRWLLLNAKMLPFAQGTRRKVDLNTCPGIRVPLSDQQVARLAGADTDYTSGGAVVTLYHEWQRPERGGKYLTAYCLRLTTLMTYMGELVK